MGWSGCTMAFWREDAPLERVLCAHVIYSSRSRTRRREKPRWLTHSLPALRLVTSQGRPLVLHLRH
jgi:hypothetical protein